MKMNDMNLTGSAPADLVRENLTTALGVWRDQSAIASRGRELEPTLGRLSKLFYRDGINLIGDKGRARGARHIRQALGDQMLAFCVVPLSKSVSAGSGSFYAMTQNELGAHKLEFTHEKGCQPIHRTEKMGSMSRHAAARYMQRANPGVTLADLAIDALHAITTVDVAKDYTRFNCESIPLPIAGSDTVAMVSPKTGDIITFLRMDELGPRRASFAHAFCQTTGGLKPPRNTLESTTNNHLIARLLQEGGAVFAETRDYGQKFREAA